MDEFDEMASGELLPAPLLVCRPPRLPKTVDCAPSILACGHDDISQIFAMEKGRAARSWMVSALSIRGHGLDDGPKRKFRRWSKLFRGRPAHNGPGIEEELIWGI